jgi:GDPmannose 4,6-dehydratase
MKKKAIIFGVSGQDGSYLAKFLIDKNYTVLGLTRNTTLKNLFRLKKLHILNKVKIIKGSATDDIFLKKLFKKNYDVNEVYYLAGYSSVINSFLFPKESLISNSLGILNILHYVKNSKKKIKVFNAASGQFFGNFKNKLYNENSKIVPQSPYGVAKAAGYYYTKIYRESYNLFTCSGILFNHESPLRSKEFVTKKIIDISKKIKKNNKINLELGNIDIYRDWGWAPEYVEAMWLMLQQKKPIDLVLGTGKKHSIRDFVNEVFKLKNINIKRLKANQSNLKRKNDIISYKADIKLAKKNINWSPKVNFKQIVKKMLNNELF